MLPRGSCFRLSFRPSFKQWLIREKYLQSPIDNFPGRLPLLPMRANALGAQDGNGVRTLDGQPRQTGFSEAQPNFG